MRYACQNDSGGATAWLFRLASDDGTDEFDVVADDDTNWADAPTAGLGTIERFTKYMTTKFPNGVFLPAGDIIFGVTPGTAVDGSAVTCKVELIMEQLD